MAAAATTDGAAASSTRFASVSLATGPLVANAGCGGGIAYASAVVLGAEDPPIVALLAFAVTMFSYAVDRVLDPTAALGRVCVALTGLLWLAVVLLVAQRGFPLPAFATIVFPLSVVAYVRPLVPGVRRVKDLPFVKPVYVAFMLAQLVVLAALFVRELSIGRLAPIALWMFVKFTINTSACDFKDIAEDRRRGVGSWPALLGRRRTLRILHVLNVAGAVPLTVACIVGLVPCGYLFFELLAVYFGVCLFVLAWCRRRAKRVALAVDLGTLFFLLSAMTIAR